jgi:putative tricarboxylic transport membrane protein
VTPLARLARAAPYAVLLALGAWFFVLAGEIEYVGPAGRIGPGFWPRAVLALLMLVCAWELAKSLFLERQRSVGAVLQALMEEAAPSVASGAEAAAAEPSWARLGAGVGATLAYVLLVDVLGFFLATAGYLAAFIAVGGYRRWGVVLATSLAGSFVLLAVFMKVVYVSLPLGAGPFRAVSVALLALLGVR